MGFTYQPGEWFVGDFNEATQAKLTDIALSRLLASGTAKISLFHAGGDDHLYSYIAPDGRPRPAYRVVEDYFLLGQNGGRRLDVSMARADGSPLKGVYVAGATHADGTVTLVVNPSQASGVAPAAADPSENFDQKGAWKAFFCAATYANGAVTLAPEEGKAYAGLNSPEISVDLEARPTMEIVASAGQKWELGVKLPDGVQKIVAKSSPAGGAETVRVDLKEKLSVAGAQKLLLTLRTFGGPASFDAIRFVARQGSENASAGAIPVVIRVPLSGAAPVRAFVCAGEVENALPLQIKAEKGARWAELSANVSRRSVITLKP